MLQVSLQVGTPRSHRPKFPTVGFRLQSSRMQGAYSNSGVGHLHYAMVPRLMLQEFVNHSRLSLMIT
jgi:hypothetical protein